MKKSTLIILLIIFMLIAIGCKEKQDPYDILNPSFESGMNGWSTSSETINLISSDTTYDGSRKYMKDGTSFLSTKGIEEQLTVSSSKFKLAGIGKISFLISGVTSDDVNVSLVNHQTNEVLLSATNYLYDGIVFIDNFIRIIWDVESFLGLDVYIIIKDYDDEGYINVDNFDVNIQSEEEYFVYIDDVLLRSGIKTDNLLLSAEHYINLYKYRISKETRYTYHVMGEMGWINDPNGFVYFQGDYHLFYQHHPYSTSWGPMHWGHVKSDDLVKWEYLPIAVAPKVLDPGGGAAFSGSAIEVDNELYIIYTENWVGYQHQVIAKSEDGVSFTLLNDGTPVIKDSHLPFYADPIDFRDPKIFKHNNTYYTVIGSRQINNFGQVLLFSSTNLIDWKYVGPVIQGSVNTLYKLGYMFECPDIFRLDDMDVLIMSPQQIPGHRNTHGTVYLTGQLNFQSGMLDGWSYEAIQEIDYGFDFYAPQTTIDSQGRRIMIAWMQSWNRSPMTAQYGWAGAMTIPRVLSLNEDNQLMQYPIEEIENYRLNYRNYSELVNGSVDTDIKGNILDIELSFSPQDGQSGITVFGDEFGNGTHIYYKDGYIYMDRTDSMNGRHTGDFYNITKAPIDLKEDGSVDLRILLDQFSIEVFINRGAQTITSTVYGSNKTDRIYLFSDQDTAFTMDIWDIVVE
ncbi:MAG: sucrose-6-phosphate hydrolase [Acholeplasmataceae bacterium]|jgi:beta-fructofuranosidase|nr:sucrose-6-phosphate hydrolase [Acholeplasmataceae bacterium]